MTKQDFITIMIVIAITLFFLAAATYATAAMEFPVESEMSTLKTFFIGFGGGFVGCVVAMAIAYFGFLTLLGSAWGPK